MKRLLAIIDSIYTQRFLFALGILGALYNTAAAVGADKKYFYVAIAFIVANLVLATIALKDMIVQSRADSIEKAKKK